MADTLSIDHAELLAKVDLFAGLERVALARLAASAEAISLPGGTQLFGQGDRADALYVMARGRCGVFVASADGAGETRLGTMLPGEYFGEMALLTNEPRSTTVRADGEAEVLRVERDRFLALFREEPSVARTVITTLSRRLRTADVVRLEGSQAIAPAVQGILVICLPLIPAAMALGFDPWVVVITVLATASMWVLPKQTTSYMVAFSATDGRLYSHEQAQRVAFAYVGLTLLGLVLCVPYWHALGVL